MTEFYARVYVAESVLLDALLADSQLFEAMRDTVAECGGDPDEVKSDAVAVEDLTDDLNASPFPEDHVLPGLRLLALTWADRDGPDEPD